MKLVREHINEKFIQDSDPIRDLGIGNKFTRIKPRDVLQIKETVNFSEINQFTDQITEDSTITSKSPGWGAVVYKVTKSKKYLTLCIAPFTILRDALHAAEDVDWKRFSSYNLKGTWEQWEKYFTIAEYENRT